MPGCIRDSRKVKRIIQWDGKGAHCTMNVFKVTLYDGATPYIDKLEGVLIMLESVLSTMHENIDDGNLRDDEAITIEAIEMPEEEFKALPEWTGP